MKLEPLPHPFCHSPSGQHPGQHNPFELFLEIYKYKERNWLINFHKLGSVFIANREQRDLYFLDAL